MNVNSRPKRSKVQAGSESNVLDVEVAGAPLCAVARGSGCGCATDVFRTTTVPVSDLRAKFDSKAPAHRDVVNGCACGGAGLIFQDPARGIYQCLTLSELVSAHVTVLGRFCPRPQCTTTLGLASFVSDDMVVLVTPPGAGGQSGVRRSIIHLLQHYLHGITCY